MWPDTNHAPSRGSFERPVLPPFNEPDASPTLTVSINCSWLPFIRGALQQLLLQATWAPTDLAELLLTQQRVFKLIDMLNECGSGLNFACPFDFSLGTDDWIEFLDNDFTPITMAHYVAGVKYECGCNVRNSDGTSWGLCEIERLFSPAVELSQIAVKYDLSNGVFSPGGDPFIDIQAFYLGSLVQRNVQFNPPQGTNLAFSWTGATTLIDRIWLRLNNAAFVPGGGNCGSGGFRFVTLRGTGAPPC